MEDNFQIRHGSLEYLPIKVTATKLGNPYDPTGDVVQVALPVINAAPTDWKDGVWQTVDGNFFANILVGPGGDFDLDVGNYDILVKITDNPEIPLKRAGMLSIV